MSVPPARAARGALLAVLTLATCAVAQVTLAPRVQAARRALVAEGPPSFLPSPLGIKIAAFGHRTTAADILHLWAIQWFAETGTEAKDRNAWLARVYDAITDLDPRFQDAYWLGFVSLTSGPNDLEAAYALADKALRHDPTFTLIALEAALTARRRGDRTRGLEYLRKAFEAGGNAAAQRMILHLQEARTAQQERALWREIAEARDSGNRGIARTYVRDITVIVETGRLRALIACHEARRGRPPASLDLLRVEGLADVSLVDPEGAPYAYDPRTRLVTSVTPLKNSRASRAKDGVDLSGLGGCVPDPLLAAP